MSLLETEVPVRNVITTGPKQAKALENDLRAKILDMLVEQEMTIEAMQDELARRGEDKAETTVRHHVNVLKEAGMVELARLEEAGGGTRKYYRSNTRVFSYELPAGADEQLTDAQRELRGPLADLLADLAENHGERIESIAEEMRPCEYCETQHYVEFVVRELLDRALLDLGETGDLDELLD